MACCTPALSLYPNFFLYSATVYLFPNQDSTTSSSFKVLAAVGLGAGVGVGAVAAVVVGVCSPSFLAVASKSAWFLVPGVNGLVVVTPSFLSPTFISAAA